MINKRHILAIDFIVLIGSLLIIASLIGYSRPLVIAPLEDTTTTDTSILFEFERAEVILIDDNLEFTSPQKIYVEDNLVINLKPGVYYWKVQGALFSDVRKLTIESEVELKIRRADDKYELVNSGNTRLNVDIYESGELTGNIVLGIDESEKVSGTKFIGGQEDE